MPVVFALTLAVVAARFVAGLVAGLVLAVAATGFAGAEPPVRDMVPPLFRAAAICAAVNPADVFFIRLLSLLMPKTLWSWQRLCFQKSLQSDLRLLVIL